MLAELMVIGVWIFEVGLGGRLHVVPAGLEYEWMLYIGQQQFQFILVLFL